MEDPLEDVESIIMPNAIETEVNEEDREDLSTMPTQPMTQMIEEEKNNISQFESIESIVYYLETEYGFERFKRIYEIVKDTEETGDENYMVEEYLSKLSGVVDENHFVKNLFLFLSLKRAEEQASSY